MAAARLTGALIVLVLAASVGAQARDSVRRVQLDRDAPLETLRAEEVPAKRCGAPYGCSRLILVDGARRVALSTLRQRGRPSSYKWQVGWFRAVDLTGDGIRDIIWKQETVGPTASSPVLFAVAQWSGRVARRIFTLRSGPARGFVDALPFAVRVRPGHGGRRELSTTEWLYRASDGDCCPSALRRRRHRWNGRRIAVIPGTTHITPLLTNWW